MVKPQFGLRTMLAACLAAAMAFWWYFIGQPAWKEHKLRQSVLSIDSVANAIFLPRPGKAVNLRSASSGTFVIEGGIDVQFPEFTLTADRALLWTDNAIGEQAHPRECYLEGNVSLDGFNLANQLTAVYFNTATGDVAFSRDTRQSNVRMVDRAFLLRRTARTPVN